MSEPLSIDEIVLKVPASADYARVVRVGAAAVALRQGMSFTEIDELRAAVDEATVLLLGQPGSSDAAIECVFRTADHCLEVEARRTDGASVTAAAADRFKSVVDAASVTATVDPDRGWLLMHKPLSTPAP